MSQAPTFTNQSVSPEVTQNDIYLIRSTWRLYISPNSDYIAKEFYKALFRLNPRLQGLFSPDMTEQRLKLMQTIGVAVFHADKLGQVLNTVQMLGQRHTGYGVKDADYDTVGTALITAFKKHMGPIFTSDVEAAWIHLYVTLANVMKDAAKQPKPIQHHRRSATATAAPSQRQ